MGKPLAKQSLVKALQTCITETPLSRPTSAQYMRYITMVEAMVEGWCRTICCERRWIPVTQVLVPEVSANLLLSNSSFFTFYKCPAIISHLWPLKLTLNTNQFQNLGNWKPLGFQTLQLVILRSYLSLNALQGCAPTQSNNSATDPEFTTTSVLLLNQLFDSLDYMPHEQKTRSKTVVYGWEMQLYIVWIWNTCVCVCIPYLSNKECAVQQDFNHLSLSNILLEVCHAWGAWWRQ